MEIESRSVMPELPIFMMEKETFEQQEMIENQKPEFFARREKQRDGNVNQMTKSEFSFQMIEDECKKRLVPLIEQ